jgi:RNA polymerase sigma factor (sigma-70 family)
MEQRRLENVLYHLGQMIGPASSLTDAELLERFNVSGDQAAFELLLRRHGPLVWNVCRRLLGNPHDAEDALQATLLVFVRKAATVGKQGSVAGWLYRVAYRIALRARANLARQQRFIAGTQGDWEAAATDADLAAREIQVILHEELDRLPEKYRVPLVLCDLEGKTHAQAAQELYWPVGTLHCRVQRGREQLRKRLNRRGVALSIGSMMTALAANSAEAALPASLTGPAIQAALRLAAGEALAQVASLRVASLTEGALRAMHMNKLKIAAAFLVLFATAGIGAGAFLYHSEAASEPGASKKPAPAEGKQLALPAAPRPPVVSFEHKEAVKQFALAPDGQTLATQSEGVLRLWNALTGKELRQIPLPQEPPARINRSLNQPGALVFSPDGQTLAWAGLNLKTGADSTIRLWEAATGKELRTWDEPDGISALSFSPNGKCLAAGTTQGEVLLWDWESGKELQRLQASAYVYRVLFSPDGKKLAACRDMFYEKRNGVFLPGRSREMIFLWDAVTGKEIGKWEGHLLGTASVAFSPNGQVLASVGTRDQTLRLWEVATGREIRSLAGIAALNSNPPYQLAFSPDGHVLSLGNGLPMIRFEDAVAGKMTRVELDEERAREFQSKLAAEQKKWDEYLAQAKQKPGADDKVIRALQVQMAREIQRLQQDSNTGIGEFVALPEGAVLGARNLGKTVVVQDVTKLLRAARPPAIQLSPQELTSDWDELGRDDLPRAYQAIMRLCAAGDKAVPFVHDRIRALPEPDAPTAPKLVADLASDQFTVRQQAFDQLEKLGERARTALEKAQASRPSLEVQRRLQQLLDNLADYTPEHRRLLRAIQLLEQAATPAAKQTLDLLAKGAAGPRLAEEAKLSLARLAKRASPTP